jgi:hypothetical protein
MKAANNKVKIQVEHSGNRSELSSETIVEVRRLTANLQRGLQDIFNLMKTIIALTCNKIGE